MKDWVRIVSIGAVAIVTILSFVLLPSSPDIHSNLVYGLLALTGVYGIGAGIKYGIESIKK